MYWLKNTEPLFSVIFKHREGLLLTCNVQSSTRSKRKQSIKRSDESPAFFIAHLTVRAEWSHCCFFTLWGFFLLKTTQLRMFFTNKRDQQLSIRIYPEDHKWGKWTKALAIWSMICSTLWTFWWTHKAIQISMRFEWIHIVWKLPKMSHLNFGIFHQFLSY